jgi:hypothetical protein
MSTQLSTLADRKTSWSPGGARAQPAFLAQKMQNRRPSGKRSESAAPMSAVGGYDLGRISIHAPPCADATGNSGEFPAACPARVQTKLAINQPGDEYEQEADRVADAVMAGHSAPVSQSSIAPSVQRDEPHTGPPTEKPKSEEEKYKEAAKKLAEALRATEAGKQLEARVTELGKDFLSTTEGKAVAATALAGALAGIIATNSELPVQVPEIPLDWLAPGLKAKLTWEGPVRTPTNVGLTLTTGGGVSVGASYSKTPASPGKPAEEKAGLTITIPFGGSSSKTSGPSESERIRAETARLAAENAKWQEAFKTPEQRAEDQAFWDAYWRSKMSDPFNPLARPDLGFPSPAATDERKKQEDLLLMRESTGDPAAGAFVPPIVHEVLRSPGQPLDPAARVCLEPRFGHDFSRVRVHTDARAAESARAVNALAYTVGKDVVFGAGQYAPQMTAGRRLLAHELAHVVQQSRGAVPANAAPAEVDLERSADQAAEAAVTGSAPVLVAGAAPASLARQPSPSPHSPKQPPKEFAWAPATPQDVMKISEARWIVDTVKNDAECSKRITSSASVLPAPAAGWARDAAVMGLGGMFLGKEPTEADGKLVCTGIAAATISAIKKAGLPFVKDARDADRPGGYFTEAGMITGAHTATRVDLTNHRSVVFDWWATMDINDPLIYASPEDFVRADREMRFSRWPGAKPPAQPSGGGDQ